jgi:hypothetical protein
MTCTNQIIDVSRPSYTQYHIISIILSIVFESCKFLGAEVNRGVVIAIIASVKKTSRPATQIQGSLAPSQPFPVLENRELRHLSSAFGPRGSLLPYTLVIQIQFYDPFRPLFLLLLPPRDRYLPRRRKDPERVGLPLCKGAIDQARKADRCWVEDVDECD